MEYTQDQINSIVAEAREAAYQAAIKFFQERLNGQDQLCCGFAWVDIYKVRGNSKLGKQLKAAGLRQNYTKAFSLWNPSALMVQNIDTLEEGAEAAARVFKKYGFEAYAGSRLD